MGMVTMYRCVASGCCCKEQGFFQRGRGGAFAPLGSLSPSLGTGRFVNDNSSLMYG